jgi:hypothetical protein
MGKLLGIERPMNGLSMDERTIIQQNIFQYLENTYTAQSKRLQGTPVYVTFYNKNLSSSMQDVTLETPKELLGYESPLLYNKVEHFPLYLVNNVDPSTDLDETFGLNTEGTGEGVILPNTIKPYIDDFIKFEYMDEEFLFQITKVDQDKFNGQKFYKIEYRISQYQENQVEEQIDTEYITEYQNIGTKENPIIEKHEYLLIEQIKNAIVKLKKFYIQAFMNNRYHCLLYKYNDKLIYNEFLIRFIRDNDILENIENSLFGSNYIQEIFPESPARYEIYETTLYSALSENNIDEFIFENMITNEIPKNDKDNPFSLDYEDYYRVIYCSRKEAKKVLGNLNYSNKILESTYPIDERFTSWLNPFTVNQEEFYKRKSQDLRNISNKYKHPRIYIEPHENSLIENINNGIKYNNKKQFYFENIIIMYFNKQLVINEDFIDEVMRKNFYPSFKEYLLMPCLIFILKNEIKRLTNIKIPYEEKR